MKRIVFALSMLACATHIAAQDISYYTPGSDEGIVYFLPKTALEVNIIATHITYQPGELCQYANQYLRMNNIKFPTGNALGIKRIEVRSAGVPRLYQSLHHQAERQKCHEQRGTDQQRTYQSHQYNGTRHTKS